MSNNTNDIVRKKEELEQKLARLQEEIDHSFDEVKDDVTQSFSPAEIIKKYPLPVVGSAFLLGIILGKEGKTKSKSRSSSANGNGFSGVLLNELKKYAVKKGVQFIKQKVDQKLSASDTDEQEK